ncbi:MAG: TCP-1/cpn60 chaperonin family protein [Chloroflexota bacterium]
MNNHGVVSQPDSAYFLRLGFNQLADVLALTLGPTKGSVLNFSTRNERPEMLNDAATIARRIIQIPDRRQDVGAMLLRQLVWQMHQQVGDGGAITAVIAKHTLDEATRMVAAGGIAPLIQNGIKKASAQAVDAIKAMSQPADNEMALAAVAEAVTGHQKLSWILGEMFDILGKYAFITVEKYMSSYLERIYLEGGRWSGKLISPYLITAPATQKAIQQDCYVALFAGKLHEHEDVAPLLSIIHQQKTKNLYLLAYDITSDALNALVSAHQHQKNGINIVAGTLNIGGQQGVRELEDLAILTGATVLGDDLGRPLSSIKASELGRVKRAEADKENLYAIQGGGDPKRIREEIQSLQTLLDHTPPDDEDIGIIHQRLARFSGSVGILQVGAISQTERDVLEQKAKHATRALSATLMEGYVPGGGVAYLHAAKAIDLDSAENDDERMGMLALKNALSAPFIQLLTNAGIYAPEVKMADVMAKGNGTVYHIIEEDFVSAVDAGIVDATKMTRMALETAVSGAVMALSVDVTVLKKKPRTNKDYTP